jgi:hypothetical protein
MDPMETGDDPSDDFDPTELTRSLDPNEDDRDRGLNGVPAVAGDGAHAAMADRGGVPTPTTYPFSMAAVPAEPPAPTTYSVVVATEAERADRNRLGPGLGVGVESRRCLFQWTSAAFGVELRRCLLQWTSAAFGMELRRCLLRWEAVFADLTPGDGASAAA